MEGLLNLDLYEFFLGDYSYIPLMTLLIIILVVIGKFVGNYPSQLPPTEHPRRNLIEVVVYFLFTIIYLAFSIFILSPIFIALLGDSFYIGLILSTIILFLLIIYVRYRDHWTSKDLGINSHVKSYSVAIVSISLYLLFGIYNFFRLEPLEMYWYILLLLFYSNAFLEEITFRGLIQTKLEQALGQKKAIIYQAILFMLIHIPANIFRFSMDGNIARFFWNFAFQFVHGLIFGLIFLKTRNIWASVVCHYLNNWMGALIVLVL
jgi:membrane protease YdiL (CAAX protease family)